MAPTFASAAAQNQNSAREGTEWSRRPNGATQTFRRPSGQAPTISTSQPQDANPAAQPARYVPPHRNGPQADLRYSREQLLELYKTQQSVEGSLSDGLPDLYIGGWQPDIANGVGGTSWGRNEQNRDNQNGPDICWDRDGTVEPLGLIEMDEEERELFTTSVNTPLKPPTGSKENQQSNGLPGRKISISAQGATSGGYGPLSPTSTRGPGRRRETSESFQFPSNPLSPTAGTFNRDEQRAASPPPSLVRRRTDVKDASKSAEREAESDDKSVSTPLSSLKRTTTGPLSAGFGTSASPWSNTPQSAGLSPMGSFGNFGLGQQSSQSEKRPGLGSGRAESRFKNLLNRDSGEESTTTSVERKTSMSSLSRLNENESWRPQQSQDYDSGPLEESEEDLPSGSGPLSSSQEAQHFQGALRGFGTPGRSESRDDYGFGAFGMTLDNASGFGQGFFQHAPPQRQIGGNEAMSPTDTNPYQSPEQQAIEHLTDDLEPDMSDINSAQLPGLGGFGSEQMQHFGGLGGLGTLPNLGRPGVLQDLSNDRSQTSSAGANRGFTGLGGMGPLGGVSGAAAWPVSHGGIGTPTRQTSALPGGFGNGFFAGGMGDLQSPGLAGLGSGNMMSPQISAGGSRMASMFPPAMQEQMRQAEQDRGGERPFSGVGEYGRLAESSNAQEELQKSQMEQERAFDQQSGQFSVATGQLPQQSQQSIAQPVQSSQEHSRSIVPSTQSQTQSQGPPPSSSASNQPPPPQQRTMVMPDRMRWIYRDPQGQTQGPWSGLEMHDWYKAGFFSPELLVKKYEDAEYEPLAQLIRRIGNSREPFLVPQIGIPHGAPSSNGPNAWAGPGSAGSGTASGGAQPPFASSFPSFGTTLTAEQQNALERRKQEEQYLMARQKEHLAQAQIAQRMQQQQMHHGGVPHHGSALMPGQGQLQHHGSSQSLHSQPSIGSMASPSAGPYQSSPNQPAQGQAPGFFDSSLRGPGQGGLGAIGAGVDNLGQIREEEIPGIMDRLDLGNRAVQGQYGAPSQPFGGPQQMLSPSGAENQERQVQQMLEDRARLLQEQEMHEATQDAPGNEQTITNERLLQFQQLQGKIDARFQPAIGQLGSEERSPTMQAGFAAPHGALDGQTQSPELSLTEQVQKAASVQQSPVQQHSGLPQPFPPAPSQSPLPAPAAQRTGRQSVADQLQTEQRDLSETPSTETPSAIAPWARESSEASRGPSLKEIQEMEAKKAAEAEEVASAARRAAFQKEMEAQAQVSAAPGLPASASWAGGSPATPTGNSASAWTKAAQKSAAPTAAKSMAQIQKEEEARKKKIASATASAQATAVGAVPVPTGGKSYANLAGKAGPAPVGSAPGGGAWTTVGASGKPKTPAAPPVSAPIRTTSSGVVATVQSTATAVRKPPTRSSTGTNAAGVNAQEEFRKWAVGELRPDLNKGISAEEFVGNLVALPQDADMMTEAVHGASSTIDSRHFAEEFIRRKKLADKGIVDAALPPKSASPHSANVDKSGGWSEVAKKGPPKEVSREESNGNFRVVASKKKGTKR